MSSDYTIVIPTYNRHGLLSRILQYYDNFRENINIIIGDSSVRQVKQENECSLSKYKYLNINYNKYHPSVVVLSKLSDIIDKSITDYTVICADDDLIIPYGIKKSIEALEKEDIYSCAHGYYHRFRMDPFFSREVYLKNEIISNDPLERLNYHFLNYVPTFYAVRRTDLCKLIYGESKEYTYGDAYGEMCPSMLTSIYGNIKRVNVVYCFKKKNVNGPPNINYQESMMNPEYHNRYLRFRECLLKHLQIVSPSIDLVNAQRKIDRGFLLNLKEYTSTPPAEAHYNDMSPEDKQQVEKILLHLGVSHGVTR